MLIFFPTIKKLYPYYLKKLFNWTFWLTGGVGFLWIFLRMIFCYKLEEEIKEAEQKVYLSIEEQKSLTEKKGSYEFLSTKFQEKEFTIEYIFKQSIVFFLVWIVTNGGAFVVEPVIRNLLAFTRPTNIWKETKKRTGEDEMVLVYTSPIRRREMVLSKMLAFITRYLIISFLFSTLPYLINPHNLQLDNWALLIKFFFFDGLLFPLIFSFFFSFHFWFIELGFLTHYILFITVNSILSGTLSVAKQKGVNLLGLNDAKNNFLSKYGPGPRGHSLIVICFLLWGFFFGWLHISDFEEIQFS